MKHYTNGTKFSFIRTFGSLEKSLGETLKELSEVLYGVVEANPYFFDWDEIIPLYNQLCGQGGDIDEFCSSHVTGYSLFNGFSADDVQKEAMYLRLRSELYAKRSKGEIK
ncbi:hypothetical protein [Maribacter sp. HTCC2170]|uniref:hypothetical protein n=1 Tax=Maribacter sp. (strain HTCC2170 / KCCM 42371) TaxID=313603 RepID=UPI00006BD588|nr:hypothetical protein [Maribacter sp. HTCC2170]EAR03058.1 hypothetical protein FB2170_07205 [Maribacter sp. HTCC2170]